MSLGELLKLLPWSWARESVRFELNVKLFDIRLVASTTRPVYSALAEKLYCMMARYCGSGLIHSCVVSSKRRLRSKGISLYHERLYTPLTLTAKSSRKA